MKKYFKKVSSVICAAVCALTAFVPIIPNAQENEIKYEAEDAVLSGVTVLSAEGYSQGKYVYMTDSGSIDFNVKIPKDGYYSFNFVSEGIGSDKVNYAALDGVSIGEFSSKEGSSGDCVISYVYAEAGSHKVTVTPGWGWINLDCLIISPNQSEDYYSGVSKNLINPNASDSAKRLYSYIVDNYGKNVISGQNCDDGLYGSEFTAIKNLTGETPAILGMDLMRYTPVRTARGDKCQTVENAIEFSNAGGIVELHWHWNAPDKYLKSGTDENGNPRWWGGFYTSNLNMDFSAIMNGKDSEGYELLMEDIDEIAKQLLKLKQADVSVLFRPLHEASGGWFWWGSGGAEPYKKLWKIMYEKLTNEYGLDNLIWVWNGQSSEWYPGDEYVDIIGEDVYPGNHVYNPQSSKFNEAANYSENSKVVALTENGCLFDIDSAISAGTLWSWFCVWSGDFCSNGTNISEKYTQKDMWKSVYSHENVITLDELPDLKSYPFEEDGRVNINDCEVNLSSSSFTYTSDEIKPSVTVKYNGKTLKANDDYTVSYSNNVNVGTAKVIISGNGGYAGKISKNFTINKKSISSAEVSGLVSKTYTGGGIKPVVTVKIGSKTLKNSTDYTVSYSNNVNVGKATVKISGKGNYTGTVTKSFNINAVSISKATVSAISAKTYTGSAIKPSVTVKYAGKTLKKNTDYVITYSSNKNAGTAKVKITGKGNFAGSVTKTFSIKKASISKASVSGIKSSYVYTAKAITPAVTVKCGGKTLKKGTDYTVKYSNNKAVGKASVTITGKGNYTGKIVKTFKIIPKTQTIKKIAAVSKGFKVTYTKFSGATGYQIQYSTKSNMKSAKSCYVKSGSTLTKTVKKLSGKKKYYVRVRTYKTVKGVNYYGNWSKVKTVTTKK